jgi:hypothetical protein
MAGRLDLCGATAEGYALACARVQHLMYYVIYKS